MDDDSAAVAAMAEAWNAHDLDGVYGRMTEDYHEYLNGTLIRTSREEARQADQAALYDRFPDYRRIVHETWGVGHRAVSRFTILGTATDGSALEADVCCIYGLRDGLTASGSSRARHVRPFPVAGRCSLSVDQ